MRFIHKPKPPHPLIMQVIIDRYSYDPETGDIYRDGKKSLGCKGKYYEVCVSTTSPDYLGISSQVSNHHLAWYFTYGEWPQSQLDHIDGDPYNNRISNLRVSTSIENSYNRRKTSNKKSSQYKGVSVHQGRWNARIGYDDKSEHIGQYDTEKEAALAYDARAREVHGEFARLNFPDIIDNMADKIKKDKRINRDTYSRSKLTSTQVLEIRSSPLTVSELSQTYGVSDQTINSILKGNSWKHLLPK